MIRLKIKNIVVFGMEFILKIMNKRIKEKRLNDNCHLVAGIVAILIKLFV